MVGKGIIRDWMKIYGNKKVHTISQVVRYLFTIALGWLITYQVSQRLGGNWFLLRETTFY